MSMDVQTSMRLPAELLDRADALIESLGHDPTLAMMGKMTRSKVLRLALGEGLAILERTSSTDVMRRNPEALASTVSRTRARSLEDRLSSETTSSPASSRTYTRVPSNEVSMEED